MTLSNEATGVERATISNEVGLYTFTSVDPATYSIVAEAPGCKSFLMTGVAVGTQQFIDVDLMTGPGLNQWDVSAFRSVTLFDDSHPITAQFRAEFINAFNTPQFQSPNIQVGGSRFGTISQQRNFPRLIQLGLRFIW